MLYPIELRTPVLQSYRPDQAFGIDVASGR